MNLSAMLLCDFYKLSHRVQYPDKTEVVYATWTPRASRVEGVDKVVAFGFQAFIKEWLIGFFNTNFFARSKEDVVAEYVRIVKHTLGQTVPYTKHIEELHDLGYLPLEIKAVKEGTLVPLRVPMMTVTNTDPRFYWVTNYVETLGSCELWQMATSATMANEYRKKLEKYADLTGGSKEFVGFQGHDFSMRGMGGVQAAMKSGMGHLLSFVGTDTIPAIQGMEYYYGANVEKELVGTSIDATEHSVQCSYGDDDKYIKRMISDVYPNGFISIVSDGTDYWDVIGRVLPANKEAIMARNGKVVIRPDSGDPVKIICGDPAGKTELERKGSIQALWDVFGGTVNAKGYKELDSHIGLIYGDAITLARCEEICQRLMANGFASTNHVEGIGSYTYQYVTRDTFGFALKSTSVTIAGDEKQIFKAPKTDDGTKVSQKGRVAVVSNGANLVCVDQLLSSSVVLGDLLEPVFKDGVLLREQTLNEIRSILRNQ